jgi:hypothetical protein
MNVLPKSFAGVDVYEWMQTRQVKSEDIKFIISFCERRIAELKEVVPGTDEQLVEGYSNFKKTLLKQYSLSKYSYGETVRGSHKLRK